MKVYTFKFMVNDKFFITEMNDHLRRDSNNITIARLNQES